MVDWLDFPITRIELSRIEGKRKLQGFSYLLNLDSLNRILGPFLVTDGAPPSGPMPASAANGSSSTATLQLWFEADA